MYIGYLFYTDCILDSFSIEIYTKFSNVAVEWIMDSHWLFIWFTFTENCTVKSGVLKWHQSVLIEDHTLRC